MRLLFSVNNFGFLRNFEPALRALAARGHDIHLLAERKDSVGGTTTIDNLRARAAGSDHVQLRAEPQGRLLAAARDAGAPLSGLLALPRLRATTTRRAFARARRAQAPAFASRLPRIAAIGSRAAMRAWDWLFRAIERAMPPRRHGGARAAPTNGPTCC